MVTQLFARARVALARLEDQAGATAIEYALMLALIAMVIFSAVAFLGHSTNNAFNSVTFQAP
jgi:Flp pilus assembly pilin Flp